MKTFLFRIFSVMLVFAVLFSCEKHGNIEKNEINLTVEGGGSFVVNGEYIEKEITVTSDIVPDKDILITLDIDVDNDIAALSQNNLIITKDNRTGKVTIKLYPQSETTAANISLSCSEAKTILPDKITYTISPNILEPQKLPEFTAQFSNYCVARWIRVGDYISDEHFSEMNSARIYSYSDLTGKVSANVSDGSICSITFANIDSAEGDDYIIGAWVDWNKDGKLDSSERILYKNIKAGAQLTTHNALSCSFAAPDGVSDGVYFMRIGVSHNSKFSEGAGNPENGDMTDIKINYTRKFENTDKPVLSIQSLGKTTLTVFDDDLIEKIDLLLDKTPDEELEVSIEVLTDNQPAQVDNKVTFRPGETTKSITVKFAKSDFNDDNKESNIAITPVAFAVTINPKYSNVKYIVNGITPVDYKYSYRIEQFSYQNGVVVSGSDDKWLNVIIETEDGINVNKDLLFTPKIDGLLSNNYVFEISSTPLSIKMGSNSVSFNLYVRGSASGKDFTLTINSENATPVNSQKPIAIEVRSSFPEPVLTDAKINYTLDGKTDINAFTSNFMDLEFFASNGEIPGCTIMTIEHTGTITPEDYYIPFAPSPFIIFPDKSKYRLRFNNTIKGKSGSIIFKSEYTTFVEDAKITINIPAE